MARGWSIVRWFFKAFAHDMCWLGVSVFRVLQRIRLAPELPEIPQRHRDLGPCAREIKKQVREDYFSQQVARTQAVRSRAQGGYTIAAAIAAAIITAGALGGIENRAHVTKVLGALALVLWLVTVVVYAQAVAGHVIRERTTTEERDLVDETLDEVVFERAVLERRLDWALYTTILAVVATVGAVSSALASPGPSHANRGQLWLKPAGATAVKPVCGKKVAALYGRYDPRDLTKSFVSIELNSTSCRRSQQRTLQIRSRDVAFAGS